MAEATNNSHEEIGRLLETDPWWKEISAEMDRVWMLRQINRVVTASQKSEVVESLFEYTLITGEMIKLAAADPVYTEALSLISTLSQGDPFPERLVELYNSKIPDALERVDAAAQRLVTLLPDPDVRSEAHRLWTSDRQALSTLELDRLPRTLYVRTHEERYVIRSLAELQGLDDSYRNYDHHPFAGKNYVPTTVRDSGNDPVEKDAGTMRGRDKYLAYRVFDPLWHVSWHHYEPEYVKFPLKWAGGALSASQTDHLYEQHKAGRDVVSAFVSLYEEEGRLERLSNAVSSCPITRAHGPLFNEAVDCYREGKYGACSVTLLPLVEGIIWEYAWWWQSVHGGLFDRAVSRTQFERMSGFELLRCDGTPAGGRPNIGQLLRQTKLGEEMYFEVVEYLCVELFDERNPVLHGREPGYGDQRKAAALLFVVETLGQQITKAFKEQIGKELLERFGDGRATAPGPSDAP